MRARDSNHTRVITKTMSHTTEPKITAVAGVWVCCNRPTSTPPKKLTTSEHNTGVDNRNSSSACLLRTMYLPVSQVAEHIATRELCVIVGQLVNVLMRKPGRAHKADHSHARILELIQHAIIPGLLQYIEIRMQVADHVGVCLAPRSIAFGQEASILTLSCVIHDNRPRTRHGVLPRGHRLFMIPCAGAEKRQAVHSTSSSQVAVLAS